MLIGGVISGLPVFSVTLPVFGSTVYVIVITFLPGLPWIFSPVLLSSRTYSIPGSIISVITLVFVPTLIIVSTGGIITGLSVCSIVLPVALSRV